MTDGEFWDAAVIASIGGLLACSEVTGSITDISRSASKFADGILAERRARNDTDVEALKARAELAEKRLAAVLALTGDEIAAAMRLHHTDQVTSILRLIRDRATSNAEEPTGATT